MRYSSPLLFNDPFDIQTGLHFDFDIQTFPDMALARLRQLIETEQIPELALNDPMRDIISLMREKKAMHGTPEHVLQNILHPFFTRLKDEMINTQLEYQKGWNDFLPRIRVFSISEESNNLLLWSHYGESHTGAVFEFIVLPQEDNPLCIAEPVIYSRNPPSFYTKEEWIDETLGIHQLDHDKLYYRYAYVKSDVWAYEKEWRVWDLEPEPSDKLFSDYPLVPKEIGSVYLGCRMQPEHKNSIIHLISQKYPLAKVYQAKKVNDKFELEFQQL